MIKITDNNWQNNLPGLIEAIHSPIFPESFLTALKSISDFDSAVIMAYGMGPRPKILHDGLCDKYREAFYDKYLNGAFLLSPLYLAYKNSIQGVFHMKDVAPEDFFNSEYFKRYYAFSGLVDQVFIIKQFPNDLAIVVSLARTARFAEYDSSDTRMFKFFEPVIMALLAKNWGVLAENAYSFSDYLHKAFENFGCSVLSKREKEVVNCMLRGSSSKNAAKEMGISTETERSYRKNIFNKLNVCSHSEIYNLFFKSLEFAAADGDPLLLLRANA